MGQVLDAEWLSFNMASIFAHNHRHHNHHHIHRIQHHSHQHRNHRHHNRRHHNRRHTLHNHRHCNHHPVHHALHVHHDLLLFLLVATISSVQFSFHQIRMLHVVYTFCRPYLLMKP